MQTIAEAFLCVAHRMCCTQQLSKPFNLKIYTILNCNARALFVFYCFFSLLFLFFLTSISRTFAEWRKWKKNLWLHFVLDLPSCKEKSLFNNIASFLFLLLLSIEWKKKRSGTVSICFSFISWIECSIKKFIYSVLCCHSFFISLIFFPSFRFVTRWLFLLLDYALSILPSSLNHKDPKLLWMWR